MAAAARSVVDATGLDIEWLDCRAGAEEAERGGEALPESVLARIRSADAALKGPVGTPIGKGFQSVNVRLRRALDLYASLRPVKSLRGVESRFENVDLIIVRENTEGLYAGIEHVVVPGVVESLKVVTERACTRVAEFAFDYAGRHHRRKVTAAHKASVMALADGLFLNCAQRVARRYPDIDYEERIIDDLSMNLVLDPGDFDVVLLENLYGDIVSDLASRPCTMRRRIGSVRTWPTLMLLGSAVLMLNISTNAMPRRGSTRRSPAYSRRGSA